MTKPTRSKRFDPSFWTEKLVTILLGILLFILLAVIVLIGMSLVGLTPGA